MSYTPNGYQHDWQVGDRAYITKDRGTLSEGDIVNVTNVSETGGVFFGDVLHLLLDWDREALRFVRIGETIPEGAVTRVLLHDGSLSTDIEHLTDRVLWQLDHPRVIVSLPEAPAPTPEELWQDAQNDARQDKAVAHRMLMRAASEYRTAERIGTEGEAEA